MFGNNGQNHQLGDVSGISLPGSAPQQPAAPAPQPAANPAFPSQDQSAPAPMHPAQQNPQPVESTPNILDDDFDQDLSLPELPEHGSPSSPATFTSVPVETPLQDPTDLAALKQQALSQLSPLVSHLDQTPEEKFRTTMMMIQASDDQTLIPQAYEAANAIEDEKARAQALLDVVNEINYFSQKAQQQQQY